MASETLLGVDFGTSNTVAVLHRDGHGTPLLFDGSPLLPSAVFLDTDQGLLVGRDAERAAGAAPAHLEPNPKRRIDEHTVWLGDREVEVPDLIAAVLRRVGDEAHRVLGRASDRVVLTHPAGWANQRLGVLTDAAARAGLGTPHLVAEPAAAAWYFITALDRAVEPGRCVVVYDLGAGTFDVAVLRRSPEGFDVLATDGLNDLGGLDLDAAVVGHLRGLTPQAAEAWGVLDWPRTPADRRARRHLWDEVRAAKEQLSRHPAATLHLPLVEADLHVTREEFERLARPMLARTVAVTVSALRAARIAPDAVAGVFLVGGSSRIPLAAVLLHQELGIAPTVIEQPELVVASGAGSPLTPKTPAPTPTMAAPTVPAPTVPTAPTVPAPTVPTVPTAPTVPDAPVSADEEPPTPTAPRRSGLLVAGAVFALAGAVLVDLAPVGKAVRDMMAGERVFAWDLDRAGLSDVFVGDLLAPLVGVAVVVVAAVLGFRVDGRRWTGGGLLAGLGLFAIGPAVFYLSGVGEPGLRGLSRMPYQAGYVLAAVGGILAVAAMLRAGQARRDARSARPVASTVLVGLGVVASLLYLGLRFSTGVPTNAVLFPTLWTAGVTVAAAVWAVLARPAHLGTGVVAGAVVPVVVRVAVDLPFVYFQWGPARVVAWSAYALVCVAMVAVALVGLRARGTSTAAAQAVEGNRTR